jgi:hypothetical protein
MAHNLTEDDDFPSTVSVPDGGDPRVAASVEPAFQSLADRTRYLGNRVAHYARFAIDTTGGLGGAGVASGSKLNLKALTDDPITSSGEFTLASNEITVPAAGVYFVSLQLRASCTNTSEPLEVRVRISATAVDTWRSNEVEAGDTRDTDGNSVWLVASGLIVIANPATETIKLLADNSNIKVADDINESRRSLTVMRVA